MSLFHTFFLMNSDDARRYAVEVLHAFGPEEDVRCAEIGDGNINYVFRIWAEGSGRSLIVKQADTRLRSSGRPLSVRRSELEARCLELEGRLAPGYVPRVLRYDRTMSALAMEDLSAYGNLRGELMANRVYPHLGENLSTFLAEVLLPTTDLVMDRQEKKKQVDFFINPEMCDITEDLVLTEPYDDYRGRNVVTPGNEAFVEAAVYRDEELHAEVAALRDGFMNHAQALVHGDLHTGSVLANERGIRIIDPEFAFYGPMGYDIGNLLGNLFFSWGNKVFTMPEAQAAIAALEQTIREIYDRTAEKLSEKYDRTVRPALCRNPLFKKRYLDGVMADALGYAGTEIIRRVVGDSKVAELTCVRDLSRRIPLERALLRQGVFLIKNRTRITSGREITEAFRLILA